MLLMPETVERKVRSFETAGQRLPPQWIHRECAAATQTTASGRVSRAARRFDQRTFVKGSGAGGCDQYDGNFDGNDRYEAAGGSDRFRTKYQPRRETAEDRAFIVSDEELTSQHALLEQQPKPLPEKEGVGMQFARQFAGTQRGQCTGSKCGKMLTAADKDQALCNVCWDQTFSAPKQAPVGGGGGAAAAATAAKPAEEEEWLSEDETDDDSDWSVESDED